MSKYNISDIQKLAQNKNGKLISTSFKTVMSKVEWECEKGHRWFAVINSIQRGSWCPYCSKKAKNTIEIAKQIAIDRGGECLSKEYKRADLKLKWKCKYGHVWESDLHHVKNDGTWCPECSSGKGERIVRCYFEQLLEHPFPKIHPEWLRNSKGYIMELDGYCKELGIAFEYQGQQHYVTNGLFKQESKLKTIQQHDREKIELCKKQNVALIEIPQIPTMLKIKNLQSFIKQKLLNNNKPIPPNFNSVEIDLSSAYSIPNNIPIEQKLQKIIKSKNGRLLSKYISSDIHLDVECKDGHRWKILAGNLRKGHWCPVCAGQIPPTMIQLSAAAKRKGGKCLSSSYINNHSKLRWQCKKGHEWEASWQKISQGTWCPYCAGKHNTIESMHELAAKRNGKCLSEKYINAKTYLKWQCEKGHVWDAKPNSIQQGTWCPECRGSKKKTIQDMINFAKQKGGNCLSKEYINKKTKLEWQCQKGHKWMATPDAIINAGRWCPECYRITRKTSVEHP